MLQKVFDDKSTKFQVMGWCWQATSLNLSQCWSRSMSPYSITIPQSVNGYGSCTHDNLVHYNFGWNMLLETVSCHNGSDVISGCTGGCHSDNLWCHQWWQYSHHDDSVFNSYIGWQFIRSLWYKKNINPNFDYSLTLHVFKCISNLSNWRAIWWHLFWKNLYE